MSCSDRALGRRIRALPEICTPVRWHGVHLLLVWCFDDVRLRTRTLHSFIDNWFAVVKATVCISQTESSCLWRLRFKQALKFDLAIASEGVPYYSFQRICTSKFFSHPGIRYSWKIWKFHGCGCDWSSGMWCYVVWWKCANVSEEFATSIFRVDDYTSSHQKSVIFMTHSVFYCVLWCVSNPL
jgi:hypothetical protein